MTNDDSVRKAHVGGQEHGTRGDAAAPPTVRLFPTLTPFHAESHAQDPEGVKRLALSESPYGPSEKAVRAAQNELGRLNLYPHSDGEPLGNAIASHVGVDRDQVLVGNGLDELILQAALATVNLAGIGVTTTNTFAGYGHSMEVAGQPVVRVPLLGGAIDVGAVIAAMTVPGCVMLPNPHNPTGAAMPREEVDELVLAARRAGTVLVLDEAYAEFATDDERTFSSGLHHVSGGSVVVLRTFSKAYGLAGLRAGYAIGDPVVISVMRAIRNALPYNTNRVALAAAAAAIGDEDHVRRVTVANRRVRALLGEALEQRGLITLPSEANFILANLGQNGSAIVQWMADRRRIHIRDATGLGFPGWARISVPVEDDLPDLLAALDAARATVD